MIEPMIVVAIIQGLLTLAGIWLTGKNSTNTAIINSNARAAVTEQKFKDEFEALKNENAQIQKRLDTLSETDSCCIVLKDDVSQIKEDITIMAASINQLKAESVQADALQMKTNMLILRHTINQGYRVFTELGHIDKESKESLLALADIYLDEKGYNGNTFVADEVKELRKLPMV